MIHYLTCCRNFDVFDRGIDRSEGNDHDNLNTAAHNDSLCSQGKIPSEQVNACKQKSTVAHNQSC